jgi:hypothetical protein
MRATWLSALLLVGCGDASMTVTVSLIGPSDPVIDPFNVDARLVKTRIWVSDRGPGVAAKDLPQTEHGTTFEEYQTEAESVLVIAEGYDELGNVVAYGRNENIAIDGDTANVEIQFRRSLAYVIHGSATATKAATPAQTIFVIDLASRGLVTELTIPGTAPAARGISARGGESILVTFSDENQGKLGVLSTRDHTWRVIDLPEIQDLTVAAPESPIGIAAGGGVLSFVDLDAGMATSLKNPGTMTPTNIGGRALDAAIGLGGRRAVVALDANLIIVDPEAKTIKKVGLDAPGGVGLSADGTTAFATSRSLPAVASIKLEQQSSDVLGAAFSDTTGIATYSEAIPGVLAVRQSSAGKGTVLGWEDGGISLEAKVPTLFFPTGITTDGAGRRAVVVAAGVSNLDAGLTVIDTFGNGAAPVGSSISYPLDTTHKARYQPKGVAVVYGR